MGIKPAIVDAAIIATRRARMKVDDCAASLISATDNGSLLAAQRFSISISINLSPFSTIRHNADQRVTKINDRTAGGMLFNT
ncbi:MAG: hypothetical protein V3V18_14090 [Methylococcales bacterium]